MCRNIRTLYNFAPPASDAEIRAAALQFVRKISGYDKPSPLNEAAFDQAVDEVAGAATVLLDTLTTKATPRNRAQWAARAKARAALRFARPASAHGE